VVGLVIEDSGEGVRVQPRWGEDVGTALAFEKKSKPEGHVVSLWWVKGFDGSLYSVRLHYYPRKPCCHSGMHTHTPRSSNASSRWRGMTVTSSISHMKAISGGVRPGGRGKAMTTTRQCIIWYLET
jgi:hypothetical protein